MQWNFNKSLFLKLCTVLLVLLFCNFRIYGQDEKFKALFIYNFTKYIEWPVAGASEFKITIIGNLGLVTEMNGIASKMKVGQKQIVVNTAKSADEVSDCQILFVSKNNMTELAKLWGKVKSNKILVITESANACLQGAGINFITKNGNLNFEISKNNIETLGLKVSSSLLNLGTVVN